MPLQYLPDADPVTPGIITDCNEVVPTAKGYRADYSDVATGATGWVPAYSATIDATALAGQINAFYAMWNSTITTGRIFVADPARIYEFTDSGTAITLTDRSAGGSAYTTTTTYPSNANDADWSETSWAFTNYGDYALAVNKLNVLQKSQTSGAFAAVSGAPKGRCIEICKDFTFIGDISGTYGSVTGVDNMLAWSALGDPTSWVPSASTQAGYVQFTDTPGGIKAVKKLGDNIVVYKRNAIYLGQYVGPPVIWAFQKVTDRMGAVDQRAITDIGNAHIFVGTEDIYLYDLTRPQSITTGIFETIKTYLAANNPNTNYTPCAIQHVKPENYVTFYGLDTTLGYTVYHYNYRYNRWGKGETYGVGRTCIPCQTNVTSVGLTGAGTKTIKDLYRVYCNGIDNTFYARISGNGYGKNDRNGFGGIYLTTGNIGATLGHTQIKRVYPRYITDPTAGTLTPYSKETAGGSWTTESTVSLDTTHMRWDYVKDARWHKFKMLTTGAMEIVDVEYDARKAGRE